MHDREFFALASAVALAVRRIGRIEDRWTSGSTGEGDGHVGAADHVDTTVALGDQSVTTATANPS